jgi:signal transduction histidine kinase
MKNSMKIKTQFIVSFTILTALIIFPNLIALFGIQKEEKTFDNMIRASEASNRQLTAMMVSFTDMQVEASRMSMLLSQRNNKVELIDSKKFLEADLKTQKHIEALGSISPKHQEFITQLEKHRKSFSNSYTEMVASAENRRASEPLNKMSVFIGLHDSANEVCKSMSFFLNDIVEKEKKTIIQHMADSKELLIAIVILGLMISFVAIYITLNNFLKPLKVITEATKKIREGEYNFRLKIDKKDEFGYLGRSFNQMLDEINQAKLIENQKHELESLNAELKIKNDSLDSFVYRVSHDLKAPIINISSLLTLVKKKVSPDDKFLNQTLGFIDDSVKKLQNTIYDLLEVSRIERNLHGESEEVNLNEIIEGINVEFGELIRGNEATLEIDFTKGGCFVDFAKANMKSILSNMISNAIKYKSPNRKPVIKLTTSMEGEFLKLKIEDNGIGIDLNRHGNNLFKMFSRFHSHVEGSGVGLYIVHKLITESGGKIEIDSDLSKGSTFNIYFKTSKKLSYV